MDDSSVSVGSHEMQVTYIILIAIEASGYH